jgi:tRNA threonylcarbamoyladenosine biosynthesis protein TsaE
MAAFQSVMEQSWTITSESVQQTIELGRRIGSALGAGDVVALFGCLGSGKTHLSKGMAVGLGVADDRLVSSPTFVLVNEYRGRVVVHHVDAYRLSGAAQLEAIGFGEMCGGDAVVIVEWADRVGELIGPSALWIELSVEGETRRNLSIRTGDDGLAARLAHAGLDQE